jgi:Ca2+-transporting ATPase
MPQEMLEREVEKFAVYARVSPSTRCASSGPGSAGQGGGPSDRRRVNDAPPSRPPTSAAPWGSPVTDVAKGAAELILTDDNFATSSPPCRGPGNLRQHQKGHPLSA